MGGFAALKTNWHINATLYCEQEANSLQSDFVARISLHSCSIFGWIPTRLCNENRTHHQERQKSIQETHMMRCVCLLITPKMGWRKKRRSWCDVLSLISFLLHFPKASVRDQKYVRICEKSTGRNMCFEFDSCGKKRRLFPR